MIDDQPIDLDAYRRHAQAPVLCPRCGREWRAVYPVGTRWLECAGCHLMVPAPIVESP